MKKIGLIGLMLFTGGVRADRFQIKDWCMNDRIRTEKQRLGRNSWAHKCKYIGVRDWEYLKNGGVYIVFGDFIAPTDPNAPCEFEKRIAVFCYMD